ncbi:MAG: NPCBM/NEW2 domain-containing protein, partial [Thermoguttaceae bacterium]
MLTRLTCYFSVVTLLIACFLPSARAVELDSAALSRDKAPQGAIWLESLDLSKIEQGWGQPRAGRSVGNNPLKLHGQEFRHGVGTHAVSEMHINLHGAAKQFVSMVGVDDEVKTGTVSFEVWVDGKKVAGSGRMQGGDAPKRVQADLRGAERLSLLVGDCDDGIEFDHADWAGAVLVLAQGATQRPQTTTLDVAPPPAIYHYEPVDPAIHGPRIVGSTPSRAFLFLIPATGEKPLHFAANNLPDGLTLDPDTGIIAGSLKQPG